MRHHSVSGNRRSLPLRCKWGAGHHHSLDRGAWPWSAGAGWAGRAAGAGSTGPANANRQPHSRPSRPVAIGPDACFAPISDERSAGQSGQGRPPLTTLARPTTRTVPPGSWEADRSPASGHRSGARRGCRRGPIARARLSSRDFIPSGRHWPCQADANRSPLRRASVRICSLSRRNALIRRADNIPAAYSALIGRTSGYLSAECTADGLFGGLNFLRDRTPHRGKTCPGRSTRTRTDFRLSSAGAIAAAGCRVTSSGASG
jgi:hypothetical protein